LKNGAISGIVLTIIVFYYSSRFLLPSDNPIKKIMCKLNISNDLTDDPIGEVDQSEFQIYENYSSNSQIKVEIKDLVRITKESKKIQLTNYNDKKLNHFLTNFEIILSTHKVNIEFLLKSIESKKSVMKELSKDMGINVTEIIGLLQNKIMSFNKNKKNA
jgi:hypothetical protein